MITSINAKSKQQTDFPATLVMPTAKQHVNTSVTTKQRVNTSVTTETSDETSDVKDVTAAKQRIDKNETAAKQHVEIADLNKHYYIALTGGFCDNIRIYCLHYVYPTFDVTFVASSIKQYEIGQKNDNLTKFNCNNVIYKKDVPKGNKVYMITTRNRNLIIPGFDTSYKYLKQHYKSIRRLLLNPLTAYSDFSKNLVENFIKDTKDYLLIGIRWRFPYTKRNHFFLYNCDSLIDDIEALLTVYNNIILMFDDWNYLKLFVRIFRDVLRNKTLISLERLGPNNVHELLFIGYNCIRFNRYKRIHRNFVHNFSGFYLLLETIALQ